MSSTRPPTPRPTRPGGAPTRRQPLQSKRAARPPWTRITMAASVLVLIAAVAVFVHALTAPATTSTSSADSGNGQRPFISHPTQHLVAGAAVDGMNCGPVEGTFQHIHQH